MDKKNYNFKGLSSFMETFHDEKTCREFLEYLFWKNKPVCSSCGYDEKIYRFKNGRTFKCANCKRNFTVTVGTIFHSSNIPLRKWFIAIYLISSHKTGISSHQIAKHLEITQANGYYLLQKIRTVMCDSDQFKGILQGIVEADETYVGGKNKNRHWDKKFKYSQGRSTVDKAPVFGLLERGGKVKVWTLQTLDGRKMKKLIYQNVQRGSIMCTDEYRAYNGLYKWFGHMVADHSKGQHVIEKIYHTQNIENFWNFIKREIMGTYRKTSRKHLEKYAREAAYRYNTRKLTDSQRFVELLKEFRKFKVTRNELYL